MADSYKIKRVNLKPLLPEGALELDAQKALKKLEREILKRIRSGILQGTFSERARKALLESLEVTLGPNSLTIVAHHPAFKALIEGQKPGQMTWLTKARAPIPIITEEGELIFRSATPQSMKDGSWQHPGRANTKIMDRARNEAREVLKKNLKKELTKQLKQRLGTR